MNIVTQIFNDDLYLATQPKEKNSKSVRATLCVIVQFSSIFVSVSTVNNNGNCLITDIPTTEKYQLKVLRDQIMIYVLKTYIEVKKKKTILAIYAV